jgi:DNA-binding transcriptional LysR family regulator
MRALNLDQLRTFAEVVTRGGFSAAALRLGLTQPAVSLQIRGLEQRLGVRLIERIGKRALPTPAGRELMSYARRLAEQAEEAVARMQGYGAGKLGRVRIGSGATACIYLLPPVLAALRRRHPGLEIIVATGNTPEILDMVEDNALDVALVTLPAARRALELRPLRGDKFAAILPPGEAAPRVLRPADFAAGPLILYEERAGTRTAIDAWLAAGGVAARPAMELGNVEAIKQLVIAGLGRSILPAITVAAECRQRRLQVRALAPALSRTLALALRRDKVVGAPLRAMLQAMERLRRP